MKKTSRPTRSASPLLLLLLLPLVVAFDYPDDTGVHAKVSAGRGTYSLSSCSRSYQSKYVEEDAAVRATFATGSEGTSLVARLQPGKTTVGGYGNWAQEELILVRDDEGSVHPGAQQKDQGNSYGGYVQFDWRRFGLQVGGLYLSQWDLGGKGHGNSLVPTAEMRLGPEYLYASVALFSSTPVLSGGGGLVGGLGGRTGNTRIWGGLSVFPYQETSMSVKLSQKLGPVALSLAGQWAPVSTTSTAYVESVHENGISLGLDFPLSRPW